MKSLFLAVLTFALLAASAPSHAVLSKASLGDRAFSRTCTITSAAAATAVHCLAAADVPGGLKAYPVGFIANVNGGTGWGTTANCFLKDTAGSPVTIATVAVAALTSNAVVGPFSSNVTLGSPMKLGTGATASKGIDVVCNANGTGSDLVVTVFGVIK